MAGELFGLDPFIIVLLLAFGSPIALLLIIAIIDMLQAKKARVLMFVTDELAEFRNKDVKDGVIQEKDKHFHVDKVKPKLIRAGILFRSFRPFYVLKHNKALPLNFTDAGLKEDETMTAKGLKDLIENKTLEQLLKPHGQGKMQIVFFILGAVIGGLAGYVISTM